MSKQSYAEKLRDPRWQKFKQAFLSDRLHNMERRPDWCDECGEDTRGQLHLHHTVYYAGREPWEYDFHEMRLYCEECHDRIHAIERDFAGFIRSIEPHECYEMRDVLQALEGAKHHGVLKVALARAKNTVRSLCHKGSVTWDDLTEAFKNFGKNKERE